MYLSEISKLYWTLLFRWIISLEQIWYNKSNTIQHQDECKNIWFIAIYENCVENNCNLFNLPEGLNGVDSLTFSNEWAKARCNPVHMNYQRLVIYECESIRDRFDPSKFCGSRSGHIKAESNPSNSDGEYYGSICTQIARQSFQNNRDRTLKS